MTLNQDYPKVEKRENAGCMTKVYFASASKKKAPQFHIFLDFYQYSGLLNLKFPFHWRISFKGHSSEFKVNISIFLVVKGVVMQSVNLQLFNLFCPLNNHQSMIMLYRLLWIQDFPLRFTFHIWSLGWVMPFSWHLKNENRWNVCSKCVKKNNTESKTLLCIILKLRRKVSAQIFQSQK